MPITLTLEEVMAGADRAAQRVAKWPEWKKRLYDPPEPPTESWGFWAWTEENLTPPTLLLPLAVSDMLSWARLGAKFTGRPIPGRFRGQLQVATLPEGWRLVRQGQNGGEHDIVDPLGRTRGLVGIRPWHPDGWTANLWPPRTRFHLSITRHDDVVHAVIYDRVTAELWSTDPEVCKGPKRNVVDRHMGMGWKWLDQHWPEHRDPVAYWD